MKIPDDPPWNRARYLQGVERPGALSQVIYNAGGVGFESIDLDGVRLPFTVNGGDDSDCYSLSPEGHYVRYAEIELAKMRSVIASAARHSLKASRLVLRRMGFNRYVTLNNWLLSTNPEWRPSIDTLNRITDLLEARHPHHAIGFRTLAGEDYLHGLRRSGWLILPNRPVYWWQATDLTRKRRHTIRSELKKCLSAGLSIEWRTALFDDEIEQVRSMYRWLYIERHSSLNADYSPAFFRAAAESGIGFMLVRRRDELVGFISWVADPEVITPLVAGYLRDINPRETPVYRLCITAMMELARTTERRLFLSTGASHFKASRGAKVAFEREAVWIPKRELAQRTAWTAVSGLFEAVVRFADIESV